MKLIAFIKNNYKNLWFAFALNLIVLLLIVLFFVPVFETNDDIAIRSFVTGEYGLYDYHFVFSNVILGYILMSLYKLVNFISWYELMHYLFIYLSLSFLTYIILNKGKSKVFLLPILLFFTIDLYAKLQFTKTSSILAISGGGLLIYCALTNEKNKVLYSFGIVLIMLGFMVRPKQCIACLSIEIAFCIPLFKSLFNKRNIIVCLLVLLLCGLCYFIDKKSYSSKEYQEYLSFNYLRNDLLDRGFPDYTDNYEKYTDLNITENAQGLYWSWDFNDPDKFTTPVMEELINFKQKEKIDVKNKMLYILKYMFDRFYYAIFILLIFGMIITKNDYSTSLLMCFLCFLFLCFYALILKTDLEDRVIYPYVFEMYILLLCSYNPIELLIKKKSFIALSIVLVSIVSIFAIYNRFGEQFRLVYNDKKINEKYLESINENDIYCVSTPCNLVSGKLFDNVNAGAYSNKIVLGGWPTNHPLILKLAKLNNISNPFSDLVKKDNVYLIANQDRLNMIIKYIEDYYCPDVKYNYIKNIYNNIYIIKLENNG